LVKHYFIWFVFFKHDYIYLGPLVLNHIDLPAFIQLFLVSAVGCSLGHIFYQRFYDRRSSLPAVEASG
ncbi:unnamed protein product, partial [Rotaria sp. Silwood2]